jgi:hypothetical protein
VSKWAPPTIGKLANLMGDQPDVLTIFKMRSREVPWAAPPWSSCISACETFRFIPRPAGFLSHTTQIACSGVVERATIGRYGAAARARPRTSRPSRHVTNPVVSPQGVRGTRRMPPHRRRSVSRPL